MPLIPETTGGLLLIRSVGNHTFEENLADPQRAMDLARAQGESCAFENVSRPERAEFRTRTIIKV